jgi:hypothetical protein
MFKKSLTGLFTIATVAGSVVAMAPAQAAGFTPTNAWFDSLTQLTPQGTIANNTSVTAAQVSTNLTANPNSFQKYVQKERLELSDIVGKKVDLSQFKLKKNYDVITTFINEGAGFRNQLGYRGSKDGVETGKGLIFQDASCKTGCVLSNGETDGKISIGDWTSLGTVTSGTQLDFILRANGANGGKNLYGVNANTNPDGLQHMVAYYIGNKLLIGTEDLFGEKGASGGKNENSDRDFNDLVFTVEIGEDNLTSVPEPGTIVALLGVSGAGMWLRRRRQNQAAA